MPLLPRWPWLLPWCPLLGPVLGLEGCEGRREEPCRDLSWWRDSRDLSRYPELSRCFSCPPPPPPLPYLYLSCPCLLLPLLLLYSLGLELLLLLRLLLSRGRDSWCLALLLSDLTEPRSRWSL